MNARQIATGLAIGRVAVGTAMFAAPGAFGKGWIGSDAGRPGTQLIMRVAGIRDLVLGLGLLTSLSSGQDARRWIEAGIVADAGDATAAVLGRGEASRFAVASTVLIAAGAAGAGAYARVNLDTDADAGT
ncbi:MAG TPA: hypothetical protein VGA69_05295 [Nitriliruptorales bacterium]